MTCILHGRETFATPSILMIFDQLKTFDQFFPGFFPSPEPIRIQRFIAYFSFFLSTISPFSIGYFPGNFSSTLFTMAVSDAADENQATVTGV